MDPRRVGARACGPRRAAGRSESCTAPTAPGSGASSGPAARTRTVSSTPGLKLWPRVAQTERDEAAAEPFRVLQDHGAAIPAAQRLVERLARRSEGRPDVAMVPGLRRCCPDEDDVDGHEPAVAVAAISPDLWREIVSRGRTLPRSRPSRRAAGCAWWCCSARPPDSASEVKQQPRTRPSFVLEALWFPTAPRAHIT